MKGYLENLRVDGRTGIEAVRWEGVDWIYLAHDDKCRTVVNMVTNLRVP